jgi:hypothetical protein
VAAPFTELIEAKQLGKIAASERERLRWLLAMARWQFNVKDVNVYVEVVFH